jgi:23S rRNA (adenine2503-C2)-methyltransferase
MAQPHYPPSAQVPPADGPQVVLAIVLTRYDHTRETLAAELVGQPRYRIDQVWAGMYEQLAEPAEMTTLPKALRSRLETVIAPALTHSIERISDGGDTIKLVHQIDGGQLIETVLMLYADRATVCVSSQAGCAMGCGFCATGQAGFHRHLRAGEIVEQVVVASRRARALDRRVSNVVFMGMGEPMANYENTWAATMQIHDHLGIGARHLTISTVGVVPGIRRLADEALPVNLAVSLHAANNTLRDSLVPLNKRYPLDELMHACSDYLLAKNRRLSFEWAMIDGVNDRPTDARELAVRCRNLPLDAHVNLIPLNPTPGYGVPGTPLARVRDFRDYLETLGVNATVRHNRGTDIAAACGQLAGSVRVAAPTRR